MTMTKKDIGKKVVAELDLPQMECSRVIDGLFEIVKDELSRGNPVMISGFGKWTTLSKRARNGRNPKTGESIKIDARTVVQFKPSHVLKEEVNSKG